MRTRSDTLIAGMPAPQFTLQAAGGQPRTLAELIARGPLLLAFHRGTW